jgi:hypothetical protein
MSWVAALSSHLRPLNDDDGDRGSDPAERRRHVPGTDAGPDSPAPESVTC